jgi:hypothetical protein
MLKPRTFTKTGSGQTWTELIFEQKTFYPQAEVDAALHDPESPKTALIGAKNAHLSRHFVLQRIIYQDRPWTNIGKAALKKRGRVAFFAALILLRAKVRKRHPFLCRYAVLNTEYIYQDGLGTNKHRGKFRNQTFPAHKGRPSLCRQAPKARPEALRRRSKAARQAGTADRRGGAGAKTNARCQIKSFFASQSIDFCEKLSFLSRQARGDLKYRNHLKHRE